MVKSKTTFSDQFKDYTPKLPDELILRVVCKALWDLQIHQFQQPRNLSGLGDLQKVCQQAFNNYQGYNAVTLEHIHADHRPEFESAIQAIKTPGNFILPYTDNQVVVFVQVKNIVVTNLMLLGNYWIRKNTGRFGGLIKTSRALGVNFPIEMRQDLIKLL